MKLRGRRHTPGEKRLMEQIAGVFKTKKDELGARKAASDLGVCLSSFYKYVNGDDLPRIEVLRDAAERWSVRWEGIDPSEFLRLRRIRSPEQLVFSFLKDLRAENVEVARIGPRDGSTLEVTLRISFPG